MARARWKKNRRNRRMGALERLLRVEEPNVRQQEQIKTLEKRVNTV